MRVQSYPKPDFARILARQTHDDSVNLFPNNNVLTQPPPRYRCQYVLEFQGSCTMGAGGIASMEQFWNLLATFNGTMEGVQLFQTALSGYQWMSLLKKDGWGGQYPYNFNLLRTPETDLAAGETASLRLQFPLHYTDSYADGFNRCGLYGDMFDLSATTITTGTNASIDPNISALTGTWFIVAYGYHANRCNVAPCTYIFLQNVTTQGKTWPQVKTKIRSLAVIDPAGGFPTGETDQIIVDGINQQNPEYSETLLQRDERLRLFNQDYVDPYTPVAQLSLNGLNEASSLAPLGDPAFVYRYIYNANAIGDSNGAQRSIRLVPQTERTNLIEVSYLKTTQDWANMMAKKAGIKGVPTPVNLGMVRGFDEPWVSGKEVYPVYLGELPSETTNQTEEQALL